MVALTGGTRVATGVYPLVIQRPVRLSRLRHQASALLNQAVTLDCRVSAGTEVSFLWDFGDGTSRPGQSTEQHAFQMLAPRCNSLVRDSESSCCFLTLVTWLLWKFPF